jgi:hypothetical protein
MGDFDDDGEAEVLLVSDGAVWGYTVRFTPGGAWGFKLFVGLVVGVALVTYFVHLDVQDNTFAGRGSASASSFSGRAKPTSSWSMGGSGGTVRPRAIARLPRSTD